MKEYLSFKLKIISADLFEAFLESDFEKLTFYKKVKVDHGNFTTIRKYFAEVGPGGWEKIFGKCEEYQYTEGDAYEVRTVKEEKVSGITNSILEYNKTSSTTLAVNESSTIYVLEIEKTINGRKCLFNFQHARDRLFTCGVVCKYTDEWEKAKAIETVKLAYATLNRYYSLSFDTIISKDIYKCIAKKFNRATLISHAEIVEGDFIYNRDRFHSESTLDRENDVLDYLYDKFQNIRYDYSSKYISRKEVFRKEKDGAVSLEIVGASEDELPISVEEKLKAENGKKYLMFATNFAFNYFYHNIKIYLDEDNQLHAKFFTVTYLPRSINKAIRLFSEQIAEFGIWPKIAFSKVKLKYLDLKRTEAEVHLTHDGVGYEMY